MVTTSVNIQPELNKQDYFKLYEDVSFLNSTNIEAQFPTIHSTPTPLSSPSSSLSSATSSLLLRLSLPSSSSSSSSSSSPSSTTISSFTPEITSTVFSSKTPATVGHNSFVFYKSPGVGSSSIDLLSHTGDNIALITSAETMSNEADYSVGFIGSNHNEIDGGDSLLPGYELVENTISGSSFSSGSLTYDSISINKNETYNQNYDNTGPASIGVGVGGGSGTEVGGVNSNGGSGSNFMLLLEDFGEYFYNYNSNVLQSSTSYPNTTDLYFRLNCSSNYTTTCIDTSEGKFCT